MSRLVEAALTLGAKRAGQLLGRVVIPGILPDLYRDQRILLGWAWTYLIVAELIGTKLRHHLVHHAAGPLPAFCQCLRGHHHHRHHRSRHRHAAGFGRPDACSRGIGRWSSRIRP